MALHTILEGGWEEWRYGLYWKEAGRSVACVGGGTMGGEAGTEVWEEGPGDEEKAAFWEMRATGV